MPRGERELEKTGASTPYPGWDELERERREETPAIGLTVRDPSGAIVRRIDGPTGKGFHRIAWDLRSPSHDPITAGRRREEWEDEDRQPHLVAPDLQRGLSKPTATSSSLRAGTFEVVRLREGALPGAPPAETAAFLERAADVELAVGGAIQALDDAMAQLQRMRTALDRSTAAPDGELDRALRELQRQLFAVDEELAGNRSRRDIGEPTAPSVSQRLRVDPRRVRRDLWSHRHAPPEPRARRAALLRAPGPAPAAD
jgi:hypothetical protein